MQYDALEKGAFEYAVKELLNRVNNVESGGGVTEARVTEMIDEQVGSLLDKQYGNT